MKKLLTVLVLALVGLLTWLALAGSLRESQETDERVLSEAPDPAPNLGAPVYAPSPQSPPIADARRPSTSEDSRERDTVSLLVVRAEGGTPVAGAEVAYLDLADLLPEEEADLVPEHPLGSSARRFETDERGRLNLPSADRMAWVTATYEGLVGFVAIPPEASSARLELLAKRSIAVRVLRSDGTPATAIPVALMMDAYMSVGLTRWHEAPRTPIARAITDGEGRAWLLAPPKPWVDADHDFRIEVDFATSQVGATWRPDDAPEEVVVLQLPPFGSVQIHLVRPDGLTLVEETEVVLLLHGHDIVEGGRSGETSQRTTSGTALFPLVELGLDLDATAIPLEGVRPGTASYAGPRNDGARVAFEVEVEGAFAFVTGRLVDEHGSPLANRRFEFLAEPGSSGIRRTDALGRFSIGATAETSVLELARTLGEGKSARIELGSLVRGTRELGDVVLPGAN